MTVGTEVEWQRPERWYVESVCGQWRVSKARVDTVVRYTLWRREEDGWVFCSLHDSAQEAMVAAT